LTGHEVRQIDPDKKMVVELPRMGKVFQRPYDKLLIATGAAPIVPQLPGFDLPGVMALKAG